jgi:hypothetical protein
MSIQSATRFWNTDLTKLYHTLEREGVSESETGGGDGHVNRTCVSSYLVDGGGVGYRDDYLHLSDLSE